MLTLPRILLADDDETFREPLAELLRRKGCECVTASSALQAMEVLKSGDFDLLISDIHMPGNTHLELIRKTPFICSGLPIILLTGFPAVETASAAVQLPVTAYLTKPLNFDELWQHASQAIARRREYLAVVAQRKRLVEWTTELEQIEVLMQSNRGKMDSSLTDAYTAISVRNALASLIDLKRFTDKKTSSDASVASLELTGALQKAIAVLEQTKQSFKSKRLGDLRTHLETVLEKNHLPPP